jgi:putative ATP-binding cassette transporter
VIADATAHIRPGERVLLQGPSGSGKSTLFRAVGGLWPWGGGKIYLPPREEMMFLPQRSYIPPGTLAAALRYPKTHSHFTPEEMRAALVRANLEEFVSALEQVDRWDKLMSLGQQQRLAFARLLLHKSKWVFLDEATSALDADNQERMMSIFNEELKESTLMSIAHREGLDVYHTRVLHLTPTEGGSVLRRRRTREWGTHWSAFTRVWKSRSKRDRSAAS